MSLVSRFDGDPRHRSFDIEEDSRLRQVEVDTPPALALPLQRPAELVRDAQHRDYTPGHAVPVLPIE
jgi:hypothetical protein